MISRGAESNHRPIDNRSQELQSTALPAELPRADDRVAFSKFDKPSNSINYIW